METWYNHQMLNLKQSGQITILLSVAPITLLVLFILFEESLSDAIRAMEFVFPGIWTFVIVAVPFAFFSKMKTKTVIGIAFTLLALQAALIFQRLALFI